MNVRLVIRQSGRRQVLPLKPPEVIIGRSRGCAVRIPSNEVSRQHCRLRLEGGLVTVEDLESVNGTFLNGQLVNEPQLVQPGDELEVGPAKFVVEYELTREALLRLGGG